MKGILEFLNRFRRSPSPAAGAQSTRYERWLRIRRKLAIGLAVFGVLLVLALRRLRRAVLDQVP